MKWPAAFLALAVFGSSALADTLSNPGENNPKKTKYRYVKLTGSLLPQRVEVKSIGTATTSNIRIIGRQEIDQSGRFTTQRVLQLDPSVRIMDNGSAGGQN